MNKDVPILSGNSRPPDGQDDKKDKKSRPSDADTLEQELLKVKAENVTLYGRLRGYKTLEQMYSQSKEEATTFRQLYEEMLAKEMKGQDRDSATGGSDFAFDLLRLPAFSTNQPPGANNDDIFVVTDKIMTDAAAGGGDSNQNSDTEDAPTSFLTDTQHHEEAPPLPSVDQNDDQNMDTEVHVSMEESLQVSEPNSSGLNSKELRVEIPAHQGAMTTSLSPDSMLFQSQLMDIVKADRTKLKKEIVELKDQLQGMAEENEKLRQDRDQRELNAIRAKHQDREGSPSSSAGDWVHVTNDRPREMASPVGATGGEADTMTAAQKAKVEKMQQKMSKLHRANREWEEHCRNLTEGHQQVLGRIKKQLADERKANTAMKEQYEQRHMIQMEKLLSDVSYQRRDREEKLERELMMEKERAATYLDRCLTLEREANVYQEQEGRRNMMESFSSPGRAGSANIDELKTQIEVLKLQVTTYTEDFSTERRDREKLQREKNDLQDTIRNILSENEKLRADVTTKVGEVTRANEKTRAKTQEVSQLRQKVQTLEQQVQHLQAIGSYGSQRPSVAPTAPGYYGPPYAQPAVPPWLCKRCSYRNDGERTFCEMCGNVKYNQHNQYYPLVSHDNGPTPSNLGAPPTYPHIGMSNRPGDLQTDSGRG